MTYDKFYAKIWKTGNGLVITVPSNLIKYGGYIDGNELEVMIKKKVKEEDELVRPKP